MKDSGRISSFSWIFPFFQFHFKDVKYMQHQAETLSLFNDGQVPCQFEFIQKPNEPTYSKPWLTANPHKGFIAQGSYHIVVSFNLESQFWFLVKHHGPAFSF